MTKYPTLLSAFYFIAGCHSGVVADEIPQGNSEQGIQNFIEKYQAAWASDKPNAMQAMWHPEGVLHHPILSEPISGEWVPANNNRTKAVVPGFKWNLVRWAHRGEFVFIEWKTDAIIVGQPYSWTGVDRMRVVDGKVMEERVYFDTFPLRAMQNADIPYTPMVAVEELKKFKVD